MSPSLSQPTSFSPKTFSLLPKTTFLRVSAAGTFTCGAPAEGSALVATDALANGASAPDGARVLELSSHGRLRSESCGTRKGSSGFCGRVLSGSALDRPNKDHGDRCCTLERCRVPQFFILFAFRRTCAPRCVFNELATPKRLVDSAAGEVDVAEEIQKTRQEAPMRTTPTFILNHRLMATAWQSRPLEGDS